MNTSATDTALKRDEILKRLKTHKSVLQKKFPISNLALFGSYARGDESPESDIDIMIELSEPMGWDIADVADYFETILSGKKIDMVTKAGVANSRLWPFIEKDLIYV